MAKYRVLTYRIIDHDRTERYRGDTIELGPEDAATFLARGDVEALPEEPPPAGAEPLDASHEALPDAAALPVSEDHEDAQHDETLDAPVPEGAPATAHDDSHHDDQEKST